MGTLASLNNVSLKQSVSHDLFALKTRAHRTKALNRNLKEKPINGKELKDTGEVLLMNIVAKYCVEVNNLMISTKN